jgi:hypothetical protein
LFLATHSLAGMQLRSQAKRERWLPLELVDAIFRCLREDDDVATLHACASTCRAFSSAARSHLLHTVFILNENSWERFISFIEDNPSYRTFMKSLVIDGEWFGTIRSPYTIYSETNSLDLSGLTLTSVTHLTIRCTYVDELMLEQLDTLLVGVTALHLEDVKFDTQRTFVDFVRSYTTLRSLFLPSCVWTEGRTPYCGRKLSLPLLDELHVDSDMITGILDGISAHMNPTSIHLRNSMSFEWESFLRNVGCRRLRCLTVTVEQMRGEPLRSRITLPVLEWKNL